MGNLAINSHFFFKKYQCFVHQNVELISKKLNFWTWYYKIKCNFLAQHPKLTQKMYVCPAPKHAWASGIEIKTSLKQSILTIPHLKRKNKCKNSFLLVVNLKLYLKKKVIEQDQHKT